LKAAANVSAPIGRRLLAALGAALVASAIAAAGWYGYRAILAHPVKRVVFAGDLDRLPHAELDALSQAIQAAPAGSVTLATVREAAKRVPWVREVAVRRVFPEAVEITFQAHEAFARWNDNQLVSPLGEVFNAEDAAKLPRLRGPEGSGAAVIAEYRALAPALAPVGAPIAELRLSARGAWQVLLESGLVLELGRADASARARRLAAAWPQVAERAAQSRYADLRYPNGFVLGTGPQGVERGADPGSRAWAPSPVSASTRKE
jgi:cell division protein FtsQ